MSMASDAGKRCSVLVKGNPDMEDSALRDLCEKDLKEGFPFLPVHWIRDIVDHYIKLKGSLKYQRLRRLPEESEPTPPDIVAAINKRINDLK